MEWDRSGRELPKLLRIGLYRDDLMTDAGETRSR
jgi:hypothetical protein